MKVDLVGVNPHNIAIFSIVQVAKGLVHSITEVTSYIHVDVYK